MIVSKEEIQKAKEKLGIKNAEWIAEILEIEQFDERNLKGLCPFHNEDTPSFIYDKKRYAYHCFGACGRSYDIIDALMIKKGYTFVQAAQELFEKADIKYSFGEVGVKTKPQYRYPAPHYAPDKEKTYAYMQTRGISKETVDYLGIEQDTNGNMLLRYFDTNDVFTVCKVRPSRKVEKSEKVPKIWYLKDDDGVSFDHVPILYNMNRVNTDSPLLITSGEIDCAAAIEAGWTNAVSIPGGDSNTQWVNECWDWLEQFDEIIICPDNDPSGAKYCKEIVPRLGTWRCRVASVPEEVDFGGKKRSVNDLNEMLYFCGKEAVMNMISHAEATPVPSVVNFADINAIDISNMDGVKTGYEDIDSDLHKLFYGSFNVVSGYPGCVDCETEFFNGEKWKSIAEYVPGDKVMQYNADGTATLVEPEQYHKYPCDTFYQLKSYYGGDLAVDQMVSEEHNIVVANKDGAPRKINVFDLIEMIWNGTTDGLFIPTSFSCDGHVVYNSGMVPVNALKPIVATHTGDGYKYCFTVPSGMLVLRRNNCINITGNSGKTSFLYSLICNVIDQDINAWVYSRELPEWMSKNWMIHMLAGRRWHEKREDGYYSIQKGIQDEISKYYDGKVYFYRDDWPNDIESVLTSMVDSARRYACKFFLLDNLMMISLGGSDENKNERQTQFVNQLISFATKYQVVVVLVCHPNKQSDVMQNVGMYQISGTSNIINLAHRAFGLRRITKKEKEGYYDGKRDHPPVLHDVSVSVIKDRFGGKNQSEYKMYYDDVDRRFYSNDEEYGRDYGWDTRAYKNKPKSERLAEIAAFENEAFGSG